MTKIQARAALGHLVLAAALATAASAHHSPAAYDLTREVVIEGTVAAVEWRNPHLYLSVDVRGPDGEIVRRRVEGASVSQVQSLGLTRDAFAPGAPIKVRAFANRRGVDRTVLGADVTVADGATYPLSALGRSTAAPAAVAPAEGIAGKWAPPLDALDVAKVSAWPITPAGRAAQAAAAGEGGEASVSTGCTALPPPMLTMLPQLRTIAVGDDAVTIAFDYDGVEAVRTAHLDRTEHPADLEPTLHGHSIGRWEGETLVIDTIGFTPHVTGVGFGVPSSAGKHMVERLTLTEDRRGLRYAFTIEDPEYLSAPATYEAVWAHRPDLEPAGEPCDAENAARYLED